MTSQGSPYGRFQRALATGNAMLALAAARELPSLGLADALGLCLVLRDDGLRFERAVLRWHARYIAARPDLGLDEAHAVLVLLGALRGPRAAAAARALAQILDGRDVEGAARVLLAWASRDTERPSA